MQFLFWAAPIQQHDCQLRVVWRSMLWDETKHQAYFVVDKTYSHDAAASCIRFGGQSVPRHSLPLAQKAHTTHNHIIYHMYIYIYIFIFIFYIYTYIYYIHLSRPANASHRFLRGAPPLAGLNSPISLISCASRRPQAEPPCPSSPDLPSCPCCCSRTRFAAWPCRPQCRPEAGRTPSALLH